MCKNLTVRFHKTGARAGCSHTDVYAFPSDPWPCYEKLATGRCGWRWRDEVLHRTGFCRRCQSERAVIRRHGAFADDDVWEEGEEEEEEEEYYSIRVWRRYYYEDGEKPTKKQGKKVRFELPADGRGPLSGEDSAAAAPGKGRGEMERGDRRKTKDRAYDPPHRPRWVDW